MFKFQRNFLEGFLICVGLLLEQGKSATHP
jgi:hypothetical protein